MPNTLNNNSFTTATTLNGVTSAPRSLIDNQLIRSSDPTLDNSSDFYKFSLNGVSNLKVNLTEVSGDVKLSIYQSLTGSVPTDADTPLNIRVSNTQRISDSYTSTSDPVLADLPAGTYYIKVELGSATAPDSNYSLLVTGSSRQVTNSMLWRDPNGSLKSWQLDGSAIVASSTFDTTTPTQVPSTLQIVSTGDFDGDGTTDVLWRDTATSTMRVWLMANGTQVRDGGNLEIQDATGQAISRPSQWTVGAIGDFDGNSSTDITWRNIVSGEVLLWFLNYSAGSKGTTPIPPSMTVGKEVTLTTGLAAEWVITGTANADGKFGQDILWRNTVTDQISIFNLSRNGLESYRILGRLVPQDWKVSAYKDFNNDGIADIIWRNEQTADFAIWNMATDPLLPEYKIYGGISADFKIIGTEDMGGDGRPDILWWNPVSGELSVFNIANDGLTVVSNLGGYYLQTELSGQPATKTLLQSSNGKWTPEAVQDFNGDGKADILWRDKDSNTLYYWKMDDLILRDYSLIKDAAIPNQTTPPPAKILPGNFISTGLSYGAYRTTNTIQVKSRNVAQVTAGSTKTSAFNIGVLEGKGSFNDSVGGKDNGEKSDWYTFTVETPSFLTALVSNSTSPNASNTALKAEVYADGSEIPIANVTGIDSVLAKGKYYIKVLHNDAATSNVATPYTLTFTGKVGITNLNAVGPVADGYGLKLNKNSIALDVDSAKNPIDITSFKFTNDGDFAANGAEVGFYVSKNGTFEPANDKLITLSATTPTSGQTVANNLLTIGSVIRGATVTLSGLRLSLPSKDDPFWDASANYSIIAVIDPRGTLVAEKNKLDNTQAATLATIGVGNADLIGTGFTAVGNIRSTLTQGSTISGTFAINNKGSRSTSVNGQSVTVKFYISNNLSIGSGDYLAQTIIIPATAGIDPNTTRQGTYSFTLPKLSSPQSTTPTKWDLYWDDLITNKTTEFPTAYVGMVIDFVDDANSSDNSNLGLGKDEAKTTVVLT